MGSGKSLAIFPGLLCRFLCEPGCGNLCGKEFVNKYMYGTHDDGCYVIAKGPFE